MSRKHFGTCPKLTLRFDRRCDGSVNSLKTCARTKVFYLLTCSRANVPWVLMCSRANVPWVLTWLTCQHVLRAYVLTCQHGLRAHVLTCQHALGPLPHTACVTMITYQHALPTQKVVLMPLFSVSLPLELNLYRLLVRFKNLTNVSPQ